MRPVFPEETAQTFGRKRFGAARAGGFLLEIIARRNNEPEALCILARQTLDDRVRRLPDTRIIDLDFARGCFVRDLRAAAVEDDHDFGSGPILIIAQLFDQCLTGE